MSAVRLPAVPLPELFAGGRITPAHAERYLVACLVNAGSPEVARVYSYTEASASAHPGVGVEFHSGAKAFVPFVYTARPGQQRGRRAYGHLHTEF